MTRAHQDTSEGRRLRRPRTLVIVLVVLALAAGAAWAQVDVGAASSLRIATRSIR